MKHWTLRSHSISPSVRYLLLHEETSNHAVRRLGTTPLPKLTLPIMEEVLYLYPEKDSRYRTWHDLRDPCKVLTCILQK